MESYKDWKIISTFTDSNSPFDYLWTEDDLFIKWLSWGFTNYYLLPQRERYERKKLMSD